MMNLIDYLNKNTTKISIKNNYITTELDLSKDTFEEAIKNEKYVKNECFINSIYDFYGDNLLSSSKKRNVIDRARILSIIGKTEDNIKNGLSINDVLPFF
jgi:hypothetical protein